MGRLVVLGLVAGILFMCVVNAPAGFAADRAALGPMMIHFNVRNYARVPDDVLSRAEAEVIRTFKEIGITVAFSSRTLVSDVDVACPDRHQEVPTLDLNLHIVQRSFVSLVADAMGIAQERGRIAYVFYNRIQEFVREFETEARMKSSLALMLSCIISHETGHLLLPKLGHRASSLMQANWRSSDLIEIETRGAHFKADQAEIIRRTLIKITNAH